MKRYKGNSITSDLTRALRISSWAIGLLYLPFYPPNSLKNQNFKRIKKRLEKSLRSEINF